MTLTIRFEKQGDTDTLFFSGSIDEDAEVVLADLVSKVEHNSIFHLGEVEAVNSCGVRAWINFIRDVEKKEHKLTFIECTPEIVSQINMIPNFKSNAEVKSVYASYVCDSCDHQKQELFEVGKNMPSTPEDEMPEVACPNCSEIMEMEELEDEFFAWLG